MRVPAAAQILRMSGLFSLLGPEAMREMQEAVAAHEGCRLYGSLPVPRVAGDFHVSVSASGYQIVREVGFCVLPSLVLRRSSLL